MARENARRDVELLIGRLIAPLRTLLRQPGGFLPFAAYLDTARRARKFAVQADESADPEALVRFLEDRMREAAAAGKAIATAIVSDTRATPPGERAPVDCAAFALDHRAGLSLVVLLPYARQKRGAVTFGEMFACEGEHRIF
ncbi:MAG: hypothetical protein OZSIB_0516 [Candidatus Ozemobacter sibiricus]|jgi:hypothetical protein|uniref:Uncharacterized protein n=1 Tax=Candidatus Ozemobacter sibiricus TaxID=2268124 RepID=A0A367ZLI7_9BACT|nr:MAG: hypothetical protein OZSIB_0516 [Candidatus Ozemobacter sibiricus]